jgi:hypothetical protein
MPAYQIHRMKEAPRQQFRWAPHTPGVTIVKPKDYEPGPVVEAASPYALWLALREGEGSMAVGDLIEVKDGAVKEGEVKTGVPGSGELRILKYIGFEEARWFVPEPALSATAEPVAVT